MFSSPNCFPYEIFVGARIGPPPAGGGNNWGTLRARLLRAKITDAFESTKFELRGKTYTSLRALGEGGYSKVYEVFNKERELFALKVGEGNFFLVIVPAAVAVAMLLLLLLLLPLLLLKLLLLLLQSLLLQQQLLPLLLFLLLLFLLLPMTLLSLQTLFSFHPSR